MAERKAVNKYYPPDWDPSKGGLDKYHGQHALRERASKLHLGILVIRFEMPFNMWCGGCNNHIGMGVRYNAEKKKIGKYYTTPIWQFRMKCHLCDNYIEIHTDPKNFDYIVASGGRRKEERYHKDDAECARAHEAEERKRINVDPMFKLEYRGNDEKVIDQAEPLIDKLQESRAQWSDDFQINRSLRKRFREETKDDRIANKRLKEKMGLDIRLKPTTKSDILASSLVRFTTKKSEEAKQKRTEIAAIFDSQHRATSILTTLKVAGMKCKADGRYRQRPFHEDSMKLVKVRQKSNESDKMDTPCSGKETKGKDLTARYQGTIKIDKGDELVCDPPNESEIKPKPKVKVKNEIEKVTTQVSSENNETKTNLSFKTDKSNSSLEKCGDGLLDKSLTMSLVSGYSSSESDDNSEALS